MRYVLVDASFDSAVAFEGYLRDLLEVYAMFYFERV